jgi:putative ABC transport system permease protein
MFQVPFQYGAPWSRREDDARAAVVVITRALNDRLFGGTNSVGETLRLDSGDYRIVGVSDTWTPVPRFYDLPTAVTGGTDALFMPLTRATDLQLQPVGVASCGTQAATPGARNKLSVLVHSRNEWAALVNSGCNWVQFWVELHGAAAVRRYRQTLAAYADEQRRAGRFRWPARVQLRDVTQWLRYLNVVPAQVRVAMIVAFGLLAACLVNAMGLILARFLPRALEVSVRRATGATRPAIFAQSLVEVGMIGVFGAGLGLLLTGHASDAGGIAPQCHGPDADRRSDCTDAGDPEQCAVHHP